MKRNRLISAVCVLSLALSLCAGGCSEKKEEATSGIKTETQTVKKAEKEDINSVHLRDKDTLYADDDETSVVTMYLTVSRGNASENTDHSWSEINSYSVEDYENMGVDRYQVAGLLRTDRPVEMWDMQKKFPMQRFRSADRPPAVMRRKIIRLS